MKYDFASRQQLPSLKPRLASVLDSLDAAFASEGLDAIVLGCKDPFISEYVPLENNHRYGVTAFVGSTGDAIYWTKKSSKVKRVSLFVDGRYHLQADQECPLDLVDVVKLDVEPSIEGSIQNTFAQHKGLRIGIDFERTSIASIDRYQEMAKKAGHTLVHLDGEKILKALGLPGWKVDRPIFSLSEKVTGRSISKNLDSLKKSLTETSSKYIHVTAATDDAAFILNARGYHIPNSSSFLAYTFFVENELVVYLPACSSNSETKLDASQFGQYTVTVIRDDLEGLKKKLKSYDVEEILFNASFMNGLLPTLLQEVYPKAKVNRACRWVLLTRVRKTEAEMAAIRKAFVSSSNAIAKTLRWGKAESQKKKVSEVDLAQELYKNYGAEGAVALSFKTISGAGPNSAIVHYSTPSKDIYFEKGQLALLDSGAYYDEGFCTDCTRGFFVGTENGAKPEAWQKDIYTTTLKAAIQVFMNKVSGTLSGKEVDTLIRGHVKKAGYDYLHGTGHGVGILVHEEGIRLSSLSTYPQSPHACVSVEPGIYLAGKGGVRVENIALLQPEGKDYIYENVVFVGYDWDLIDVNKLTDDEKKYLKSYEAQCKKMNTHLTECPL